MHALLSILADAALGAFALALVAALFAPLRVDRVIPAAAVAAPAAKPAPAEPPAKAAHDTPTAAYGGHAKGQNLDLFGGCPEGNASPTPAEVRAPVNRLLKVRISVHLHEQLTAQAQARGQKLGTCVRHLLAAHVVADEPMAD